MNQLKNLQRAQVLITCGVLTGVWTNLYVNIQSKCPHFSKCPFGGKNKETKINNIPIDNDKITDINEIKKIFNNN